MPIRKPVREQDTILVRVPDGVKDRIAQRAKANGRSMGAEAAAMLEQALNDPAATNIEALTGEAHRLVEHMIAAARQVRSYEQRLDAISEELKPIYGDNPDGISPLDYALRLHRQRIKKVDDDFAHAKLLASLDLERESNQRAFEFIKSNPNVTDEDINKLARWPHDEKMPESLEELRLR